MKRPIRMLLIFVCVGLAFGLIAAAKPKPLEVGDPAPDFTLKTHDDKTLTLSRLKGKRGVVLDFGATWCPYCMEEVPHIKKFVEKTRDKDVLVYMVNYMQSKRVVEKLVKDKALNYRVLLDSDGAVTELYGVQGFPTAIGIDADGIVRYISHKMPRDEKELVRVLTAPLKKEEAAAKEPDSE